MARPKGSKNKPKVPKEVPVKEPKKDVEVPVLPSTSTSRQNNKNDKARLWCFTIQMDAPPKDQKTYEPRSAAAGLNQNIFSWESDEAVRYCCWQMECGSHYHLQGFVQFYDQQRFGKVKKMHATAHWEACNGTADENKAYCTKEDTRVCGPWEFGTMVSQGARVDTADLFRSVLRGTKRSRDVMEEDPQMWARNYRAITAMELSRIPSRTEKPRVVWRWGSAGVGKTRAVYDEHGFDNVYTKDPGPWWEGYYGQPVVLLDDFSKPADDFGFRDFLRVIDRYPYRGAVKGSSVEVNSPIMYITCEFPPNVLWRGNELAQVVRRIDEIVCVQN